MIDAKHSMSEEELELKVNRLTDLSSELGLFVPVARYSVKSLSPEGEVIDTKAGISRSWTRNAYNWTAIVMTNNASVDGYAPGYIGMMTTTGGHFHNIVYFTTFEGGSQGYSSPIDDSAGGIVVGSGVIPESFEDYKLGTIILSGVTTNKLSYQESLIPTTSYNAGTKEYLSLIHI